MPLTVTPMVESLVPEADGLDHLVQALNESALARSVEEGAKAFEETNAAMAVAGAAIDAYLEVLLEDEDLED